MLPGIGSAIVGTGARRPIFVGGQINSSTTFTGTRVVNFSLSGGVASTPADGDLVIVAVSDVSQDSDINLSVSGYTEVADLYSNDGWDSNLGVFYKRMTSTPDTSVTVPNAAQINGGWCSCAIHVWRGVDAVTPMDVAAVTATGTNSRLVNPGAITPVTSGAVVIAVGGNASVGPQVLSSSELSNFISSNNVAGAGAADIGIGSYEWSGGSFDPAVWTTSGSDSTDDSWTAVTLALRPA